MIEGLVSGRRMLVPVTFRLSQQPDFAIEFMIDSGFAGFLTLPTAAVAALNLPFRYQMLASLADNSSIVANVYTATIVWEGQARRVEVFAMGKRPLLGTSLLDGFRLDAEFNEGGPVRIMRP
jgi:clan AA aspartic protease